MSWLILGFAIRLFYYLLNRSLWLDELWLAIDIRDGSLGYSLTLNSAQPPPGFYLIEKVITSIFGYSELSLRLFPFIMGVASMYVFWLFVNENFSKRTAQIATALFAFCPVLIEYSVTLKQYSTDVFICLLIYFLYFRMIRKDDVSQPFYYFLLASPLFSYATVFIIPGILIASFIARKARALTSYIFFIWTISFIFVYVAFIKPSMSPELQLWWHDSYPSGIIEYFKAIWGYLTFIGYRWPGLIGALIGLGIYAGKQRAYLLIPGILFFVAVSLHKIPFAGRLLLWFVPAMLIFVAQGIEWVIIKWDDGR